MKRLICRLANVDEKIVNVDKKVARVDQWQMANVA